jgi:hypothetical protein
MTEIQADCAAYHRERDLEWIESRFLGGKEVGQALRAGTLQAREQAIQGLERLASAWSRMSHSRHWAYDHAKHMHLCSIIDRERGLLAANIRAARRRHQAAVREVRNRLHQRGSAPLSLMKRLGRARGGLLAAIAGRRSREDAR